MATRDGSKKPPRGAKKKDEPGRALVNALKARDLEKVKALLDAGADPNATIDFFPPLFHAFIHTDSKTDDPAPVALLLDAGADVEKRSEVEEGRKPILEAALRSKSEVCRILVERGADLRAAIDGHGVLHVAAQGGILWLVDRCIEAGLDPRAADKEGVTPLHDACYEGRIAVAERLLDAGADVNAVVKSGYYTGFTPLEFAVLGGFPKLTARLLERGASPSVGNQPLLSLLTSLSAEEDYGKEQTTAHVPVEARLDVAAMIGARARGGDAHRPKLPDDAFVQAAAIVIERGGPIPKEVIDEASKMLNKRRSAEYKKAIKRDDTDAVMALRAAGVPPPSSTTLLQLAVDKGAVEVTRALLKAGEDPNEFDSYSGTPLHLAVGSGKREVVSLLLDAGCDIERWTEPGGQDLPENPLGIACARGDLAMVKLLLDRGASPSVDKKLHKHMKDFLAEHGCLPICHATNPKILKELLDRGADPNLGAPLITHIEMEDVACVRLLLEAGADPNKPGGEDALLPLEMALELEDTALVRVLVEHGATLGRRKPPPGLSAELKRLLGPKSPLAQPKKLSLRDAIEQGEKKRVLELIAAGADINKKDKEGETPLCWAIQAGQGKIARLLLERGAEVSPKLPLPPLYFACAGGHVGVVKELLRRGADPNLAIPFIEDEMESMLHLACRHGHIKTTAALLDAGADVNPRAKNQESALFPAAYWARVELVRLLIERGADVNQTDKNKHSVARECFSGFCCNASKQPRYLETLEVLLDAGASVNDLATEAAGQGRLETLQLLDRRGLLNANEGDPDDETPLYVAAREGHADVVRFLLDRGADLTRTASVLFEGEGWTPLHAAAAKGHAKVVRALLERGADVTALDKDGKTPLDEAQGREVRELLRKAGAARGVAEA